MKITQNDIGKKVYNYTKTFGISEYIISSVGDAIIIEDNQGIKKKTKNNILFFDPDEAKVNFLIKLKEETELEITEITKKITKLQSKIRSIDKQIEEENLKEKHPEYFF